MRGRLQLDPEEARRKSIGSSTSWNSLEAASGAIVPVSPINSDASNALHASSYAEPQEEIVNFSHYVQGRPFCQFGVQEPNFNKVDSSLGDGGGGRSSVGSSMPSGIGLHLNSIGNTLVVNGSFNAQFLGKGQLKLGENFLSGSNCLVPEDTKGWLVPFEDNQISPRKKRKREATTNINENGGCKRCNCKRTKCLKLYCDCFAAGVYCAEPCSCVDCYNRLEYEDTVLEARQQIESRNPHAFAPKIVRDLTESPQDRAEDGNRKKSAYARHKRGCNCKKSKCSKKYCECFQAGVGCSEGCRCEGCENVFGRKEEMEHVNIGDEKWEDAPERKIGRDLIHPDQRHSNITPVTPMPEFSNYGRNVKSRRLLSSPESPYEESPLSPQASEKNYNLMKVRGGTAGLVLHDQELDHQVAGTGHFLSAKWDGFHEIHDPIPLRQPHPRAITSVASDTGHCSLASQAKLSQESQSLFAGSLHWLDNVAEDETPHILKETYSPIKTVKSCSPNKKRVSPPHNVLHELGSSSSPSLRTCRKFILQAVPSLSPLPSCNEPKENEE